MPRRPRARLVSRTTLAAAGCAGLAVLAVAAPTVAEPGAVRSGDQTEHPVQARGSAWAADKHGVVRAARSTLYVSRRGDDRASGTERRPLRSIGAALDRAGDGTTVVVGSGVYRESLVVEGVRDLTLQAAPGATVTLDGARRVLGWQSAGSGWVRRGWSHEFDASPTYTWGEPDNGGEWSFVNPAHPMAAHPDQVWVDGRPLVQVSTLAQLRPGAFFVDDAADALYLGSDPSGRKVEASTLAKALSIRAPGTTVSGLDVRRYASSVPHMGSVTVEEPGALLQDMRISENATTGLFVMKDDSVLRRLRIDRNGLMGLAASGARRLLVDRVRVSRNNLQRFNPAPSAGGAKITRSQDVVVRDSTFRANLGTGLWFDESVYGITLLGNRSLRNTGHGLSLELSGKVLAARNTFAGNRGNGIKVNDTNDVALWNNSFADNRDELAILQDDRDVDPQGSYVDHSLPLTFRNGPVELRNNVFGRTSRSSSCLLCVIDYTGRFSAEQMQVSAQSNIYQRSSSSRLATPIQWSTGNDTQRFASIGDFVRTTGQEQAKTVELAGTVLDTSLRPRPQVERLAASVATPIGGDLAGLLGIAAGSRRLGAW